MDENAIGNWVDNLVAERLLMPEVQRRYVWKSTQVRDLFDSLYQDYPVGSILVWDRPMEDGDGRVADVGENAGKKRNRGTMLLLDGQQRLTSLSAIMRDKELKGRGRIDILFNVNHPQKDVEEDDLGNLLMTKMMKMKMSRLTIGLTWKIEPLLLRSKSSRTSRIGFRCAGFSRRMF